MRKDITYSLYADDNIDYEILNRIPYHNSVKFGGNKFDLNKTLSVINENLKNYTLVSNLYIGPDGTETGDYLYVINNIGVLITKTTDTLDDNLPEDIYDIESNEDIKKPETSQEANYIISKIVIYYNNETIDLHNILKEKFKTVLYEDKSNYFYTIGVDRYGYKLEKNKSKEIDETALTYNYGKDFKPKYKKLLTSLIEESNGLYLLHGEPGTGKTYLNRILIQNLCKIKKVLLLPSFMIEHLSKPEFIMFLKEHKNIIIIMEDAEFALTDRNAKTGSEIAVSNILNMTDGLFNDIMSTQIIATFNTNLSNIDSALTRVGRLKFEHKFDKLKPDDVKTVSDVLDIKIDSITEMSLAEIYNYADYIEKNNSTQNKKIGFSK